jgi:[ribosomal protein S5]-alanine N-acetyltransferase
MDQRINTERLLLDKLSLSNTPFIYELVNTAGWIKYIGDRNVRSISDAQNYVQKIIDNPNIAYWVVNLKGSTSPIGIVTLIKRDYLEYSDIGFAFLPQYTKNGYAHEATGAVLAEITHNQQHECILAITTKENTDSIRLLEKLGLNFDKEIEREQE